MPLETATYINDLVGTNPVAADLKSQGDDHIRLVKTAVKQTLNGFTGAILLTATDTGTAAAHVLTPVTALFSYTPMLCLLYRPALTNTGAITVNVSALGAKPVKTLAGADPTAGDIVAGQPVLLMYDGTNFVTLAGSEFLSKTGNQTLTGNLTQTGNKTLTGNQTTSGTMGVTGNTTLGGTLAVTGVITSPTITLKADLASPAFTGTPTAPTAAPGANSTQLATTAHVATSYAPLASPALTGTPTAPTAAPGTSSTQIATMAALATAAFAAALPGQAGNAGKFVTTDGSAASWTGVLDSFTGAAIASAATVNLNTATGNRVHITGTTAITAVTLTRGPRTVIFDGILTLTHHITTNNLPGASNITTAAGDRAIYESDGTTVYCVSYVPVSGKAVINPVATATASGLVPTPPNDATKVLSGAMTYITPASGALVLLSTVTAANSATVNIETTFNSTFEEYLLVCSDVTVASATTSGFYMLMKIGGVYDAGANYRAHTTNLLSSAIGYASIIDNAVGFFTLMPSIFYGASRACNFDIKIHSASNTSRPKSAEWTGTASGDSAVATVARGAGNNQGTAALTGIRIYGDVNIQSGNFRLYGIAK